MLMNLALMVCGMVLGVVGVGLFIYKRVKDWDLW